MRRAGVLCALAALGIALAACSPSASETVAKSCLPPDAQPMQFIPAGSFTMGEDARLPEEGPARTVHVKGFWIDTHEVTNADFARFAAATGYKTVAERTPPPLEGAPPEMLQPGSAVFRVPDAGNPSWWRWVVGAQWRHPDGPAGSIEGRGSEPVVQIAYADALAYAKWAGKDLPTETQWEYAARGGQRALPEPRDGKGKPKANFYQGVFPVKNLNEDGYEGRAPVGCFEANGYGLYDLIGNVWEWTRDPAAAGRQENVIKGGSFLCAANYCARYRPAARQFQERGLGTDHIGFRLVDNQRPPPTRSD